MTPLKLSKHDQCSSVYYVQKFLTFHFQSSLFKLIILNEEGLCNIQLLSSRSIGLRNTAAIKQQKLKQKIQIEQNKCTQFCLELEKRHHISSKKFESINWLPVNKRIHQCINAITFKFASNACPHYLNEVYEYAPQRPSMQNKIKK